MTKCAQPLPSFYQNTFSELEQHAALQTSVLAGTFTKHTFEQTPGK